MATQTSFLRSSIGRKVIMALTGVILFGFVVVHMLGNLQVYEGPAALNVYARRLRTVPELLWAARAVLLGSALLHIWAALSLTGTNREARRLGYREKEHRESTFSSRTMRISGIVVLFFIVYHLMHFTLGVHWAHPLFVEGDVFHNFVTGFRLYGGAVAAFYVVAMLCLGLHLYHGAWSWLQSLGLSHPRYDRLRHRLATAFTVLVVVGNISFPLAVLAGVIRERPQEDRAAIEHPSLPKHDDAADGVGRAEAEQARTHAPAAR